MSEPDGGLPVFYLVLLFAGLLFLLRRGSWRLAADETGSKVVRFFVVMLIIILLVLLRG